MQTINDENADGGRQGADAGIAPGKKMYYSISEACAITGVEPHILRYWEKEFSLLHPKKNSGGKRAYKEKDIEAIVKIKRMLEVEKYTLQGAKEKLANERRERRTGAGNATSMKRRKSDTAAEADSAESSTSDPSVSIPTDTAEKPARRKSAPKNDNGESNGNDYDGNDKALILSIRDELSEILALLES